MLSVPLIAAISVRAALLPIADADPSPWPLTVWSGILIGILLVLFLAVSAIRRWLRGEEEAASSAGFTLGDFRALHREGKMSDEEFERAKAFMVGQTRRDVDRALAAKTRKLQDEAPVRPNTEADLAAFAQALREKAAREKSVNPPPAAPASGDD